MRSVRILMAGFFGFFLDTFLSSLVYGIGLPVLGLGPEDYAKLQLGFSNPNVPHLLVGLLLPMLSTVIGGAAAGVLSPTEPQPAGALVGGLALIFMALGAFDSSHPYGGTLILMQCLATVLGALSATLAVRYRARARG
jgi:hypothetical protein